MLFPIENQYNSKYYSHNDEYEYSDDESVCSMNRTDFNTREQYMEYLRDNGKGYSYDKDGYKYPKVNFCGYSLHLINEDFVQKMDPHSIYEGMWKNNDCYLKFWKEYFHDFCKGVHPKSDDERLFQLYQKFSKIENSLNHTNYEDYDNTLLHEMWDFENLQYQEFEEQCEPEPAVKYSKQMPVVTKYIKKHQFDALPEHAKKYFNKSIATNKTIKVPATNRRKRCKEPVRKQNY